MKQILLSTVDKALDKTTQIGVKYVEKNLFSPPKKEEEKDTGDIVMDNVTHIIKQMSLNMQRTRD